MMNLTSGISVHSWGSHLTLDSPFTSMSSTAVCARCSRQSPATAGEFIGLGDRIEVGLRLEKRHERLAQYFVVLYEDDPRGLIHPHRSLLEKGMNSL